MKDKLAEYQAFRLEVIKKIVRAEIDLEVFNIQRNQEGRSEEKRKHANDMFISQSDVVADMNLALTVIDKQIKELLQGGTKQ